MLIEHLAFPIFHTFTSFRGQVLASFQDESSNFQFPASAFCGRCGILDNISDGAGGYREGKQLVKRNICSKRQLLQDANCNK